MLFRKSYLFIVFLFNLILVSFYFVENLNFSGTTIYFGWNDELIYCTELVWKLYDRYTGIRLGELKTLKDFDLSSPAVQFLMKKRYGNRVPYSEPVISPVDMFHSSELITVVNHQ
ncbi:Orthopoxovirus protein, PF05708 family [Leptospira santarosai]|uniref:Orthopoxovirus protein, PF05708 family n=1 Tax=Leptospira santarosai TaxID=28183 RepID=A0A2P1QW62_9LEPT|nr:Orthopoxovirus protein, PF05708 family [Leptospira santarosai]